MCGPEAKRLARTMCVSARAYGALFALPVLCTQLLSCRADRLPRPPSGPHQVGIEQVIEAEYPPPPAQVEQIGRQPGPRCVWVDGYWDLHGRRWEWESGGWFVPPAGCYRAPAEMFWTLGEDTSGPGKLIYRLPGWYPTGGGAAPGGRCGDALPCATSAPIDQEQE